MAKSKKLVLTVPATAGTKFTVGRKCIIFISFTLFIYGAVLIKASPDGEIAAKRRSLADSDILASGSDSMQLSSFPTLIDETREVYKGAELIFYSCLTQILQTSGVSSPAKLLDLSKTIATTHGIVAAAFIAGMTLTGLYAGVLWKEAATYSNIFNPEDFADCAAKQHGITGTMSGQEETTTMSTQKENTTMSTQKGNTAISTQKGDTTMSTQKGDTTISTQKGDTTMNGQEGNTTMNGQEGNTTMNGQEGSSTMCLDHLSSVFDGRLASTAPFLIGTAGLVMHTLALSGLRYLFWLYKSKELKELHVSFNTPSNGAVCFSNSVLVTSASFVPIWVLVQAFMDKTEWRIFARKLGMALSFASLSVFIFEAASVLRFAAGVRYKIYHMET